MGQYRRMGEALIVIEDGAKAKFLIPSPLGLESLEPRNDSTQTQF